MFEFSKPSNSSFFTSKRVHVARSLPDRQRVSERLAHVDFFTASERKATILQLFLRSMLSDEEVRIVEEAKPR